MMLETIDVELLLHTLRECFHDTVLTDREVEVLTSVVRGLTNKEIALALGISVKTVEAHLSHVGEKLGFDGRSYMRWWLTAAYYRALGRQEGCAVGAGGLQGGVVMDDLSST